MKNTIVFAFVLSASALFAQEAPELKSGLSPQSKVAKATEFSIPSSPAFNMLNENTPARIERYASLHDFKVDWSLTNGQQGYTLSPGLAIEAQPVWMLFFDRAGTAKYRDASPLARTLSTLSLSVGTSASTEKNWLAWAVKLNLYRENDPLTDEEFLRSLEETDGKAKDSLLLKIRSIEIQQSRLNRRNKNFGEQSQAFSDSIAELKFALQELERQQSQKLADARDNYVQKHWNSSYLDLAFGRLLTYKQGVSAITKTFEDPTMPGQMDTVTFENSTLEISKKGYGLWISGGIGIGNHAMISGMARYGEKPSQLTGNIGEVFSVGANLRYGSRRHNFFIEGFYDRQVSPLQESPDTEMEQQFFMLTIGGDWRISRNVMLAFGIRQTKDFDNGTYLLQPLVNVNCLMR